MSNTNHIIYKEIIPLNEGKFTLSLPLESKIVSLQMQYGEAVMWYRFNLTHQPKMKLRRFAIRWTGVEFSSENQEEFIGTWQRNGFVFHLFEILD